MNYSYTRGASYAKSNGITWEDKAVENFDQLAQAHNFSQSQVDICIQHFIRKISPSSYGWAKRVKIGVKFIIGKI